MLIADAMESLIDYLILTLMSYEVSVTSCVSSVTRRRQWLMHFGFHEDIIIVLDEADLCVIREIADIRPMDDDERARYNKLFELCQ